MASAFNPFSVFRKNQKVAMAFITLLSMFAFVCVGSMMGRGNSGGGSGSAPVAAKWKFGQILQSEVSERLTWRVRINRFLKNVYETALVAGKVDPDTQFQNFLFAPENHDSVLQSIVMEKKAELMGMTVSDESVQQYINTLTNGPLTQQQLDDALLKAVGDSHGSIGQLSNQFFDRIRFEILAKNFVTLLLHDYVDYDTPEERWEYFSRIRRAATVQVLPVAVKDYVDKIHDPDDAELQALFDKYKDRESRPDLPEPGFKVPARGQFQYFKAVRATLAKADEAKITDKEIEDYYNTHKENFRKSTLEDSAFPTTGEKPKTGEAPKTGETPKPGETPKNGEKPKTGEAPKTGNKPAAESPKTEDKSKSAEQPKADKTPAAPPKPSTPSPGAAPASPAPAVPKPAEPKPTDGKSSDDKSSDTRHAAHHFGDEELLALADTSPAPTTTPPTTPPAATPPASTPSKTPPATPPATTTAPPATAPPATTPPATPAPAAATTTPPTPPAEKAPPAKTPPTTPPTIPAPPKTPPVTTEPPKTPPAKTAPAAPAVEFDPVTDPKVRDTIRKELSVQKAQSEITEAFKKLRPQVQNYSRALSIWRAHGARPDDKPEPPKFKDLAKTAGIEFDETKMLSADEAREQTELGKSVQATEVDGRFRLLPFTQLAFGANMPAYMPSETDSLDAELYFLWWRTDFKDSYVPQFADVKPEVLLAWKMNEARKLALADANKYSADANKRRSTLKEIFQSRANMNVKEIGPFHWLSVANVPMGDSMQQVPQLSEVSGVEMAGPAFMRAAFHTDVGSSAVAFNEPQTIAYVVQVNKIDPPEDVFRQLFQSFQIQSETSRNGGLPYSAAIRDAQQTALDKVRAVYKELGVQQLAPTSGQASGGPAPTEDDSGDN